MLSDNAPWSGVQAGHIGLAVVLHFVKHFSVPLLGRSCVGNRRSVDVRRVFFGIGRGLVAPPILLSYAGLPRKSSVIFVCSSFTEGYVSVAQIQFTSAAFVSALPRE